MPEFTPHLVLAEALRNVQPTVPLEEVHRAVNEHGSLFVHLAPAAGAEVALPQLNNGLGRLSVGLIRLGTPDILVFREVDGQVFCGRIVCKNLTLAMYPRRWLAEQISARVPYPLSQVIIAKADLEA